MANNRSRSDFECNQSFIFKFINGKDKMMLNCRKLVDCKA